MSKLRPVRNGSLPDRVVETIRDAIFSGRFAPGQPLRELHLARKLEVSQTTVREALLQLEHAGLVVRSPNRGTALTRLPREDLRERISVRAVLEGMAAVEAFRWMSEPNFRELERRLDRISQAIASGNPFAICEADLAFHRYIWECCGNRTLYRMLDQLTAPLFAFISILRHSGRPQNIPVRSHQPIVEVLKKGKPTEIIEAIRSHIT